MRILFSFVGGDGHFRPLVPIATAVVSRGHTVAFAGRPGMMSQVQAAGFDAFAVGTEGGDTNERLPLLETSMERELGVLREVFAGVRARERAKDMRALCAQWQPDLIVCDEIDFGAMIAAESLGLPYASVLVIAAGSFVRSDVVAEPLNTVRAEYGLSPDPTLTMLHRHLVLSPFPPSYRDPAFPLPATAHSIRLSDPSHASSLSLTPSIEAMRGSTIVCFTLGTIFNRESGDLFSRVIESVRDLPLHLVITTGRHIDRAEFGVQPANIHIESFIPQSEILPVCTAVISHAGSGSVMGALAHGLPAVLMPMGADQPLNAMQCEALGLAVVLDPLRATPTDIRHALRTVIETPTYRQAAERLRDEIADLPDVSYAVELLEQVVHDKHRVTRTSATPQSLTLK